MPADPCPRTQMSPARQAAEALGRIRATAPLVHNITNYVVMNTTANALLAIGASPIMAHAVEEMDDLAGIAGALVINIGTLSPHWIEAMFAAGRRARERGIPIVLDPVGSGASRLRTDTAKRLIGELAPAIVRGNASEIRSLLADGEGAKGVDSRHTPDEVAEDARALARRAGCVVSVSGPVDLIVGDGSTARISNGDPIMTRVTGMGCTATAVTGAFAALGGGAFDAATHAMIAMGVAGQVAAAVSAGPGSFQVKFLDALAALDEDTLVRHAAAEVFRP